MSYANPAILLFQQPIGINAVIQSYQQDFYAGIPWLSKSFGRAYEQPEKEGDKRVPKVYSGKGEYHNVLPNDNLNAQSFIITRGPERRQSANDPELGGGVERDISLVFWMNLKAIDPADDTVFTEVLRWDVEKIIKANPFTKDITDFYDDRIEDIFLGYMGKDDLEKGKQWLMYPYAGFRFDVTVGFPVHSDCVPFIRPFIGASSSGDMEFTVGQTTGAPAAGSNTFSSAALVGKKIRLNRGGLKQPRINFDNRSFYSFDPATGTITAAPKWQPGETFSIEIYGFA